MRRDGEIIKRNNLREFHVQVNLPFPIWQVRLLIKPVLILIWGVLNPIRLIIPLNSYIHSYPLYCAVLQPPSLFLVQNSTIIARTQSYLISLHLWTPWSWAHTEYSVHWMQHSCSSASTQDCQSSLESDDYGFIPECSFSFCHASLQDWPPPAMLSLRPQR